MKSELFIDRSKCCGCGVCANICKLGAIQMVEDSVGFLYPVIDKAKCVGCGMCEKHCPILAHDALKLSQHHTDNYAGYLKKKEELLQSASGGAATEIARAVLRKGGVVFGVSYTENYHKAISVKVDSLEALSALKDSKYMQSEKGSIYGEVKTELDKGIPVLYTGTPCEIGAVKAYLGKEYENLYTCELICHGTTPKKVAEKFIKQEEKRHGSHLVKMSVKSKELGWSVPHIKLEFENGKCLEKVLYQSDYGIAFAVMLRESCYQCSYKGDGKVADITVGDFWGATKTDTYWNEDGISAISIHTPKGKALFQELEGLEVFPVNYETILKSNPNLEHSEPYNRASNLFRWGFQNIGLKRTVAIYKCYKAILVKVKRLLGK